MIRRSSVKMRLPLVLVGLFWIVWTINLVSCSGDANPDDMDKMSTEDKIQEIIAELRGWQQEVEDSSSAKPFVTAAFAQSLDGYMAAYIGPSTTTSNFPLSGDESMLLTHALRSVHDGILVGGRTLLIDNPRLTNRLWGGSATASGFAAASPQPIVLDSNLSHIQKLGINCRLRNPIICCSVEAASRLKTCPLDAQILACQSTSDGRLDIRDVLHQLKIRHGIRSVMVEGGASVLSSCFEQQGLVDALCITIAPKLLHSGIAPTFLGSSCNVSPIDLTSASPLFVSLGQDTTLVSRYPKGP